MTRALRLFRLSAHWLVLAWVGPGYAASTLVITGPELPVIFGDLEQSVRLEVRNPSSESVTVRIGYAAFQRASGMAMPLRTPQPWREITVLAGQTVLAEPTLRLPGGREVYTAIIRWRSDQGESLGTTEVGVVPGDIAVGLSPLLGGMPLGLLDPGHSWRSVLERQDVALEDLAPLPRCPEAKVLLLLPLAEKADATPSRLLKERVRHWLRQGRQVLWVGTPRSISRRGGALHEVRSGDGRLVLATADWLGQPGTAQASMNLLALLETSREEDLLDDWQ